MNDERPISFVGTTAANDSTEEVYQFEQPGVITGAEIVTHTGQEYALRNYAQVIRDGTRTTLWEALGEQYLAGDGEDFSLSLRFEFQKGDKLVLKAENASSQYDYHHNMTLSIDYAESIGERIASALRGVA